MSETDILTLTVSGLALAVSIVTWYLGQKQEKKQMRASVREQLSRVVQDLIEAQGDLSMLDAEAAEQGKPVSPAKSGSANHRLTSLARQACELIKLEENVAFDVEYIAVANALWTSGDLPAAELYFKRAIEQAPSAYYKAINLSMYGDFLFSTDQAVAGRLAFEKSVSLLANTDDFNRRINSRNLQSWGSREIWYSTQEDDKAGRCFDRARRLILEIGFTPNRESFLRELESRMALPAQRIEDPAPSATAGSPAGQPQSSDRSPAPAGDPNGHPDL
jgi:tetratricopeptide (TPR) repeat protein